MIETILAVQTNIARKEMAQRDSACHVHGKEPDQTAIAPFKKTLEPLAEEK